MNMKEDNKKAIIASGFTAFTLLFFLILVTTQKPNTPEPGGNPGGESVHLSEEDKEKMHAGIQQPRDLYVDEEGSLYITDAGNFRFEKFNAEGTRVMRRGNEGTGEGEFTMPSSIISDSDKNMYVLDSRYIKPGSSGDFYGRIQVFAEGGEFITQWSGSPDGPYGELLNPRDFIFDKNGDMLLVDTGNNRILKFKKDGTFIKQIGTGGSNEGEFSRPFSIDIDQDGNMYVLELGNTRIQVLDPEGRFIRSWVIEPWAAGAIPPEAYLALSPDGQTIFVTDPVKSSVYRFLTNEGRLIVTYDKTDKMAFRAPLGIAINTKNNTVVISDVGLNVIHELKP